MGIDPAYAYHYTTLNFLESMMGSGYLVASTNPYSRKFSAQEDAREGCSERVREIICHEKYLVCLLEPEDPGWKESGLLKKLFSHTTREVLLEVPVLEKGGAFLRDAIYLANYLVRPKWQGDLEMSADRLEYYFGLHELSSSTLVKRQFYRDYLESTTRMEDYDGSFEAPELWLFQDTPIEKVRRLKIGLFSQRWVWCHRNF